MFVISRTKAICARIGPMSGSCGGQRPWWPFSCHRSCQGWRWRHSLWGRQLLWWHNHPGRNGDLGMVPIRGVHEWLGGKSISKKGKTANIKYVSHIDVSKSTFGEVKCVTARRSGPMSIKVSPRKVWWEHIESNSCWHKWAYCITHNLSVVIVSERWYIDILLLSGNNI